MSCAATRGEVYPKSSLSTSQPHERHTLPSSMSASASPGLATRCSCRHMAAASGPCAAVRLAISCLLSVPSSCVSCAALSSWGWSIFAASASAVLAARIEHGRPTGACRSVYCSDGTASESTETSRRAGIDGRGASGLCGNEPFALPARSSKRLRKSQVLQLVFKKIAS